MRESKIIRRILVVGIILSSLLMCMTACKKEQEIDELLVEEEVQVDPFMEFVNSVDADNCNFSGVSGDNIDWFFKDNVLIIKGAGDIDNTTTVDNGTILFPGWMDNSSIVLTCKTVYIEEGITNIPNYSFSGMEKLSKITIPSTVKSIGESAFAYCGSIKNIDIPNSVEIISNKAFYKCIKLTDVTGCTGLKYIGDEAFRETALDNIPIEQIETLKGTAFFNTPFLERRIAELKESDGIWVIGNIIYKYVDGSKNGSDTIEIPDDIITIGDNAFLNSSIKSVKFGKNTAIIGDKAFYGCLKLESVDLGHALTGIGNEAFSNCLTLKSIEMPDTVTSIGERVFKGCSELTSVVYGKSLKNIPNETFSMCNKLADVTLPDNITDIDIADNAFLNTPYIEQKQKEDSLDTDETESSTDTSEDAIVDNDSQEKDESIIEDKPVDTLKLEKQQI